MPNPMEGKWYVTKTLLACNPDINKRILYYGDTSIMIFNSEMRVWSEKQEQLLNEAVERLNQVVSMGEKAKRV